MAVLKVCFVHDLPKTRKNLSIKLCKVILEANPLL